MPYRREDVVGFEYSAKTYPNEQRFGEEVDHGDRWQPIPLIEELKARARAEGLWNLFLPAGEGVSGLWRRYRAGASPNPRPKAR
jgi:acyl-CoA dehydrogenase